MKYFLILFVFVLFGCANAKKESYRDIEDSNAYKKGELGGLEIVKYAEPYFPSKAARRKKQGWCISQFDIDSDGVPQNIEIVDCSPEGYFEEACRIQTAQLRYANKSIPSQNANFNCVYKID